MENVIPLVKVWNKENQTLNISKFLVALATFVHKLHEHKLKLDNKNTQGIFVGYDDKSYRV
jgi:hypothetical protein